MTRSQDEIRLIQAQCPKPRVLVGIGSLYHIDHLFSLGNPQRMILFDPEWQHADVISEEISLLKEIGAKNIQLKEEDNLKITFSYNGATHFATLWKIKFDVSKVNWDEVDILHGPHLIVDKEKEELRQEIKKINISNILTFNVR